MPKIQSSLSVLRELIAGAIALAVVFWTMKLLAGSLSSPSEENLKFAQGIFSILGGSVGVVLGYYFGRIPAEKLAESAEKQATTAQERATKEEIARRESDTAVSAFERSTASLISRYEAKLKRQQAQLDSMAAKIDELIKAV